MGRPGQTAATITAPGITPASNERAIITIIWVTQQPIMGFAIELSEIGQFHIPLNAGTCQFILQHGHTIHGLLISGNTTMMSAP